MMSEPRPLQVVVVSHQVSLLHEVSWTLEAVGVKVQTSDDYDQDALWRRYSIADFVIVDAQPVAEPTAATFAHNSDNPIYRLFLYDPSKRTDFAAWYAAGAHDALRTPVSRGELLARIRAGARYLEFERRLQNQSSRSVVPGMYSRRGFLRKLQKPAANDSQRASQNTLLVTAIDWYAGIRQIGGETASNSIVNTAARAIKRVAGESSISAYLGDGRFATLLVGQSLASVKDVAESLAKDFGSRESHHESIPRPAITSAVVPWSANSDSVRCLIDALETLALAEHSGGGRVLQHGEFSKELAAWNEEISTGNPFASVVAQDIMEPFPAFFSRDAEQAELNDALHQADIAVRPYVDREGRLAGVASDEHNTAETVIGDSSDTFDSSLATLETIPYDATFPEIYEAFSTRGCGTLVVTAEDRPLGYVTREGFLSMIDPIHAESFANNGDTTDKLSYLVVPSTIGSAEADVSVGA
jgi:GGDEF domain-containing protein